MADSRLTTIRQFFDTTGKRLNDGEKNILCEVIGNPDKYNGYTSELYERHDSGKDYRGRWESSTSQQFRINMDQGLSISERYKHECDDGYSNSEHWDWDNAWVMTDVREIAKTLMRFLDI